MNSVKIYFFSFSNPNVLEIISTNFLLLLDLLEMEKPIFLVVNGL